MATIDTAIALALQQFKVDRLKAEQKSNFTNSNLMKLFKNKKCKKLTDGGHQVMAKSHMPFGQLR
jgi:hypothetical protein